MSTRAQIEHHERFELDSTLTKFQNVGVDGQDDYSTTITYQRTYMPYIFYIYST